MRDASTNSQCGSELSLRSITAAAKADCKSAYAYLALTMTPPFLSSRRFQSPQTLSFARMCWSTLSQSASKPYFNICVILGGKASTP